MEIYLDNGSTTQMAPEVIEAMRPYFDARYGNPSSRHRVGQEAARALEESRQKIAGVLGARTGELIFTSGATESNNLALFGAARARKRRGGHIISTLIEHDSVLEPLQKLEQEGFFVTYLEPDRHGRITIEQTAAAMREDTFLVSIMHAQNELGTIYPINEIARELKKKKPDIVFFSDGAQAFGKLPVNLDSIDLYSISAHKLHGPKGVGAIYIKNPGEVAGSLNSQSSHLASGSERVILNPIMHGGGQERGLRPGTENVPAIVGFAKAAELAYANLKKNREYVRKLKNRLVSGAGKIESAVLNSPEEGLETTVNFAFPGIQAKELLRTLNEKGIYASAGSACSLSKDETSRVLRAIPVKPGVAASSIRFGLSRYNTIEEIDYVLDELGEIVFSLRKAAA